MKDILPLIKEVLPEIIELRHDLHRHPELSYEEERTAAQVLAHLEKIPGIEIQTGVAETGIVALLAGDKDGPCVALRADMDALPIEEQGDLPYRSQTSGKMHACGHDGHTSCLVGAARVLGQCVDELQGPVKFVFQPAEEDFAFYLQRLPGFQLSLGLRADSDDNYPLLHQANFDFSDAALPYGIKMHVEIARRFAGQWARL